jgi:hypothetical protein
VTTEPNHGSGSTAEALRAGIIGRADANPEQAMPEQAKRVVRATLRCLRQDLAQEVGPDELKVALRTVVDDMAADPTYLLPCPLVDAEHAVIEKANLLATDEAAHRERIEALTDRYAIKVKTGDRRAALWQDEDGTWWLLAAGRRKNDTAGDFYREIERFSADATPIAPTDDDYRLQRLETAYEEECEAERAAHAEIVGAVLSAARVPGSISTVDVFGAAVSVRIVPDEAGLAVLEMSWEFAEFDQQDRFPMDVLAMVPGRDDIDAWDYLPPLSNRDSPHTWYTYVTAEWVDHMATSAELDELLTNGDDWQPVNPSSDGSEHYSHLAKGSIVTLAYLTGIEITALCGASIVAHRDYERFPVCPTCQESLTLLRSLRNAEGA